jgi:hypothetical protein
MDIRHTLRIIFVIIQFSSFQVYLRAESTARGTIRGTGRRDKNKNIEDKTYNWKHKRILKQEIQEQVQYKIQKRKTVKL